MPRETRMAAPVSFIRWFGDSLAIGQSRQKAGRRKYLEAEHRAILADVY
jgi:hypothetical protein